MRVFHNLEEFIREFGSLSPEEVESLTMEGLSDLFGKLGDKIQDEGETIRIDKETFTALLLLSERSRIDLLSQFAEILKGLLRTETPETSRRITS